MNKPHNKRQYPGETVYTKLISKPAGNTIFIFQKILKSMGCPICNELTISLI